MPTGSPRQGGFTYLFVLMLIGLMGLGLALAGTLWRTEAQREREADLLFIGAQYRQAIQRYYELDPNQPRLPQRIDDLLEDRRQDEPVRHLRRAWPDPFGGPFRILMAEDGHGIVGVASASGLTPFRRSGFAPGQESFENAASYSEWHFEFAPTQLPVGKPSEANGSAN